MEAAACFYETSSRGYGIKISTNSFSETEVQFLIELLKRNLI